MPRPALEVADIFRDHGAAWRSANGGHVSLDQLKVMSAIECCRTAALGGHVARCEDCSHTLIAYSCAHTKPGVASILSPTVQSVQRSLASSPNTRNNSIAKTPPQGNVR